MINRFKWLEVKPEVRRNIAIYLSDIDGFPKLQPTGHVEVAGNKVVCDGFTDKDLCAITPELLRAALGVNTLVELNVSTTDVYAMFYELVRRMELPPVVISPVKKEEPLPTVALSNPGSMPGPVFKTELAKKKLGRPKKSK